MHAIIKSSCIIGISIITSSLGMAAARADYGLQVDFSGAGVWNSPTPTFVGGSSRRSPEIINTARRLSQELEKAYVACDESIDCQELALVIQNTKDFLTSLNRNQRAQLRRAKKLRIW